MQYFLFFEKLFHYLNYLRLFFEKIFHHLKYLRHLLVKMILFVKMFLFVDASRGVCFGLAVFLVAEVQAGWGIGIANVLRCFVCCCCVL